MGEFPPRDIAEAISVREKLIARLQKEIKVLREAEELLGVPNGALPTALTPLERRRVGRSGLKWERSIGDACEEILKEAGPLHLEEIYRRVVETGINTTIESVDSALRKDKQERFALTGVRTYGLKER